MRPRASVLTGALTSALFLFVGGSFVSAGQTWAGVAFIALGLFRGGVAVRRFLLDRAANADS